MEVALVGCGSWGRHILRDLRSLGCAVHVAARSEESRARAVDGGAATVAPTVSRLDGVAGVVVATPTTAHAETCLQALALGVPVFVEKPLASDPAGARALADIGGGRLFVMDKWRYHPGVLAMSGIARSGTLGPVLGLRTARVGWGGGHGDTDTLWHLAPHEIAIALEILGEIPAPAACRIERVRGRVVSAVALMGRRPWAAFEVSSRRPDRIRRADLLCEGGVASLPSPDAPAVLVRRGAGLGDPEGGPAPEEIPLPPDQPLLEELRAFVGHLKGGPPPRSSAPEGLEAVEAIAALERLAVARNLPI